MATDEEKLRMSEKEFKEYNKEQKQYGKLIKNQNNKEAKNKLIYRRAVQRFYANEAKEKKERLKARISKFKSRQKFSNKLARALPSFSMASNPQGRARAIQAVASQKPSGNILNAHDSFFNKKRRNIEYRI